MKKRFSESLLGPLDKIFARVFCPNCLVFILAPQFYATSWFYRLVLVQFRPTSFFWLAYLLYSNTWNFNYRHLKHITLLKTGYENFLKFWRYLPVKTKHVNISLKSFNINSYKTLGSGYINIIINLSRL